MMKFTDLFAGAGGLGYGLKQSGMTHVEAVEIDEDAVYTYMQNVGPVHFDNIVDVVPALSHDTNLICGGPPCQGFSTAGAKRESDPRNMLYKSFVDVVNRIRPRVVLFENVSGFRTMYNGKMMKALVSDLEDLGYHLAHGVLNAADFGVPQYRKRFFCIGCISKPIPLPIGTHHHVSVCEAIEDLQGTEMRVAKHSDRLVELISHIPQGQCLADVPPEVLPYHPKCFGNSYGRLDPYRPSPTLTRNFSVISGSPSIHPFENRGLSIEEAMRIQTFPDDYEFCGSLTSIRKQIGNAVPPLLARKLGEHIQNELS